MRTFAIRNRVCENRFGGIGRDGARPVSTWIPKQINQQYQIPIDNKSMQ